MKPTSIAALLAALAITGARAAEDDTDRRPPPPPRPGPTGPLLKALDADSDGTISSTELTNAATALKPLDTDGDGAISLEEVRPAPPKDGDGEGPPPAQAYDHKGPPPPQDGEGGSPPPRPHGPPLFAVLDGDHDGTISAGELSAAGASLAKLDKNGDGQLTPEETRPPGRPPGGPQGGPPPEGARPDGPPPGGEGERPAGPSRGGRSERGPRQR